MYIFAPNYPMAQRYAELHRIKSFVYVTDECQVTNGDKILAIVKDHRGGIPLPKPKAELLKRLESAYRHRVEYVEQSQ